MPERWPSLPLDTWRETYTTLHMWTQVVGKICLALTPLTNHFWNIAFQITPTGLTTPTMNAGAKAVTIAFDFTEHRLIIRTSDGPEQRLPLEPMTVADFYARVTEMLAALGIRVRIWATPVEIPDPIPFDQDVVHHSYDRSQVESFHAILLATKPVFESFRGGFIGKCSPVHFFWGSFDVAVTRFSGDRAPERPGADSITREAYSHAVISHGFWPGSGAVQEPAFYAYASPEPDGLKRALVRPAAAYYHQDMSEFILPYEAVRSAASPSEQLTAFLESTYEAAAELAGWNRSSLERSPRVGT